MTTDGQLCPTCQTPLPATAHFCLNCGTPTPTEPGVPARIMPTGAVEVSRIRAALADRDIIEHVLGEEPMFKPLRGNPRFEKLLAQPVGTSTG